ncbi:hypothetical protein LTR17_001006 [Elasticomyces elasticus]|nr:hypothetical protein LTR17_001006 [Elasticomyces elasticus]
MVAELSTLLERNDQRLPPNRFFGKISFKMKRDERPMRRRPFHGQSFTTNSIQAKFTRAAPKVKSFSIYVSLEKDFALRTFNAYKDVVLAARYLSFDGVPRDDWWNTRDERYHTDKPSRYQDFVDDSSSTFPPRPWLVTEDKHSETKHNQMYNVQDKAPRTHHFMGALLFERDEVRRAKQLLFNHSIKYPAKPMTLSDEVYTICIKLKGNITLSGVGKIVPSPHAAISVLLAGKSNPDDCDTFF